MFRSKLLIIMALVMLVTLPAGTAMAQEAVPVLISAEEEVSIGTAVIWDDMALSDAVTYTLDGVPIPSAGTEYVGWMVSDDGSKKLSTGVMQLNVAGEVRHTFDRNDPRYTGENLIHVYNKVVITEEAAGADPAEPAGPAVYSHAVPLAAMMHIRHLLTNWPPGDPTGILTKLQGQLDVAIRHASLAKNSDTLEDVIQHTHHVINIIEGSEGDNYDAAFGDPGDGFGIVNHAADSKHAGFAAGEAPDDAVINEHALLVEEYGSLSANWALLARNRALQVLTSNLTLAKIYLGPGATTVTSYLEAARDGFLADGGAKQAYEEAQRMATYTMQPGPPGPEQEVVPPPETVGDPSIPLFAQIALGAAALLLGAGGLLLVNGRRSRPRA